MGIINHSQLEKGSQVTAVRLAQWIFLHKAQLICSGWALVPFHCTHPGLGSVQQSPQPRRALFLAADLHVQCKSHSKSHDVRWAGTRGRDEGVVSWGSWKNHTAQTVAHVANSILTWNALQKVELNTDLGFSGSNPGDRALFKRDRSKKTSETPTEGMKCVDDPEPKGISRPANALLTNWRPLAQEWKMREDLYLMVSPENKNYSHVICFSPEERNSSSSWI